MTAHVPFCLYCGTREVSAPFTFSTGEGFCSAECETAANADEADVVVEDYDDEAELASMMEDARYDAFLSQYDDDPSVYSGTYSEE